MKYIDDLLGRSNVGFEVAGTVPCQKEGYSLEISIKPMKSEPTNIDTISFV